MNWIRQMKLGYSINLSDNRILNETDFFLHELKRSSASIEEFSSYIFFGLTVFKRSVFM